MEREAALRKKARSALAKLRLMAYLATVMSVFFISIFLTLIAPASDLQVLSSSNATPLQVRTALWNLVGTFRDRSLSRDDYAQVIKITVDRIEHAKDDQTITDLFDGLQALHPNIDQYPDLLKLVRTYLRDPEHRPDQFIRAARLLCYTRVLNQKVVQKLRQAIESQDNKELEFWSRLALIRNRQEGPGDFAFFTELTKHKQISPTWKQAIKVVFRNRQDCPVLLSRLLKLKVIVGNPRQ